MSQLFVFSLLTSLWICLLSSYSSRPYCFSLGKKKEKKKKKKPPAVFKLAKLVFLVFLDATGKRGLGSIFFLSCGSSMMGAGSRMGAGSTVSTSVHFPAHTLKSAVWTTPFTLCICTRLALTIHLVVQTNDQSMRCPE